MKTIRGRTVVAETISWSFTAGASSGAGLSSNGTLESEAVTSAVVALDANMSDPADLTMQLEDVDRIAFLAVSASIADGSIEIRADGADPTPLTGPLLLYGAAVRLFAGDLSTLKVQNKHATDPAKLSVLIGSKLSA
jgi:hypothetical protein